MIAYLTSFDDMQVMIPAINLQQVHKQYPNHTALLPTTFSIASGSFFALLGPNGAGKSTLINILSTITNKTSGKISVLGYDLDQQQAQAKLLMGVVPQEINLNIFETPIETLVNQAAYYGVNQKDAISRGQYLLEKLQLSEKQAAPIRTLSGGMKRRLMIARALIHQPKILILDEPTAGVDVEIRQRIWQFLKQENQNGLTILLTTHYLEEVEALCDDVAILKDGQLVHQSHVHSVLEQAKHQSIIVETHKPIKDLPNLSPCKVKQIKPHSLAIELPQSYSLNQLFKQLTQKNIIVTQVRQETNPVESLLLEIIQGKPA
jgi:ABC-2 type transport system ATP-binding protein